MRRRSLPVLCALALAFASTVTVVASAHAQGAPPSAADRDTARKLLDDGDAATARGDHEAALKSYQAAHAIMNLPSTGIEVAKAQAAVGQLIEARETALEVARMPTAPREPAVFAANRKEANELASQLDPRIASLRIKLSGVAANVIAEVKVDGATIPTAAQGLPRRVNPGAHKITATAPGYIEASADVDAAEGASVDVPIEMKAEPKKIPPPPPPPTRTHKLSLFVPIGLATLGAGLGVTLGAGIAALKSCHKGAGCGAAIGADVGLGVAVVGAGLTTAGIVLTVKGKAVAPADPSVSGAQTSKREVIAPKMQIGLEPRWGGGFLGLATELQ